MKVGRVGTLLAGCFCLWVPATDAATVGVYADTAGEGPCIEVHEGEFLDLYVVVRPTYENGSETLSAVRFKVPDLSWRGIHFYENVPVFPSTTTDHLGVTTAEFGACLAAPIHVLTIKAIFTRVPPPSECFWLSLEEPIGATDCNGNPTGILEGVTLVDTICHIIPPSNPYPADGASFVPGTVVLTWDELDGPNYCSNINWYTVYFGTTTNPPLVTTDSYTSYDPPGSLQPNATYYWRVLGIGGGGSASSPLWSFSTGEPLAVERSTWGKIKALYR